MTCPDNRDHLIGIWPPAPEQHGRGILTGAQQRWISRIIPAQDFDPCCLPGLDIGTSPVQINSSNRGGEFGSNTRHGAQIGFAGIEHGGECPKMSEKAINRFAANN
jgi:hypothetical protein